MCGNGASIVRISDRGTPAVVSRGRRLCLARREARRRQRLDVGSGYMSVAAASQGKSRVARSTWSIAADSYGQRTACRLTEQIHESFQSRIGIGKADDDMTR